MDFSMKALIINVKHENKIISTKEILEQKVIIRVSAIH